LILFHPITRKRAITTLFHNSDKQFLSLFRTILL